MDAPLIGLHEISKHYGEGDMRVDALKSVSLDIFPRQIVGLLGPSGSGKSTLLNVIGCIVNPNHGKMVLDGDVISDGHSQHGDLRSLRLNKIGFIFQAHNLIPFLTSVENIAIVLQIAGKSPQAATARAMELLDYLEVSHRAHTLPAKLSGGEAQRVAIARALANRPRIILADEPTAALDSERAGIVMDLMRKAAIEQDAAVIVVTHDEKIYDRLDTMYHLRDGTIDDGTAAA